MIIFSKDKCGKTDEGFSRETTEKITTITTTTKTNSPPADPNQKKYCREIH